MKRVKRKGRGKRREVNRKGVREKGDQGNGKKVNG